MYGAREREGQTSVAGACLEDLERGKGVGIDMDVEERDNGSSIERVDLLTVSGLAGGAGGCVNWLTGVTSRGTLTMYCSSVGQVTRYLEPLWDSMVSRTWASRMVECMILPLRDSCLNPGLSGEVRMIWSACLTLRRRARSPSRKVDALEETWRERRGTHRARGRGGIVSGWGWW